MKLVHKALEKDGAGMIALVPEESEDMWHAFNLIQEGDAVRASTVRKVINESATGSRTNEKVRTTLTVQVEDIDFDTQVMWSIFLLILDVCFYALTQLMFQLF